METYSKVTRFCFICNYVSRIIEPLASRCAKFRFKPLNEGIMSSRISFICEKEGLDLSPEAMATLSFVSGGDLRRAITTLQSSVRLGGPKVDKSLILDVSGQVPPEVIEKLLNGCKGRTFAALQKEVNDSIAEGYAAQQILLQLQALLLSDATISDVSKGGALEAMAISDSCLVDGADEMLQLLDVVAKVQKELQRS
jgi:replication factor C subunit 2/4